MKKSFKGFTLIELLIVIAVLGILAVAVLSAINPIEQINRSRDTGNRSDSEQLLGAIDRYYAQKGRYPWLAEGQTDSTRDWAALTDKDILFEQEMLNVLSAGGTGELKASFVTRIVGLDNPLHIYNSGATGASTYVCFKPKSKSFESEAYDRCTSPDSEEDFPTSNACPATGCTSAGDDPTDCYSCLP